jgi:protein involved in polysaccharide export with SLBB domain
MRFLIPIICALIVAAGCSSQSHPAVTVAPEPVIYVHGEFYNHGEFAWTNGMKLQDAIDAAGGLTDFATRHLRLTHPDGSIELFTLTQQHTLTKNPFPHPGDKINSPRH